MKNHQLITITFKEDKIYIVEHEGEPYVPMKPIIDNLGINWPTQFRKLRDEEKRWRCCHMTIPSLSGFQETLCLPIKKVPSFLMTIAPRKVSAAIRPKLELYQAECDQVLWDYWTKGHAERFDYEAMAAALPPPSYSIPDPEQLRAARREGATNALQLILHCQKRTKGDFVGALHLANKIIHYRRMGLLKKETALLTGISISALQTMEKEIRDCGYSYPRIREVENIPAIFPYPKAVEEVRP